MNNATYPMLLTPVTQDAAWAGDNLARVFSREQAAVSLELCPENPGNVVENGPLAQQSLNDLIASDPKRMVGPRHGSTDPFPIRCSFFDVGQQTALEVHPALFGAEPLEGVNSRTKAWYVVAAESDATVIAGIKAGFSRHLVASKLDAPGLERMLQQLPSEPGDAYFISPGRVNALSAGNLIFCVEQNEGDTLLVSDWNSASTPHSPDCRSDLDATRAIHFQDRTLARIRGDATRVPRNRKMPIVQHCPFFTMDEWQLVSYVRERTQGLTFHLVTCIEGSVQVEAGGVKTEVPAGRSCYVPAAAEYYTLDPLNGHARLLRTALRTM